MNCFRLIEIIIKKRKGVTRSRNKRKRKEKFRGEKAATRVFYRSLLKKGNNKIIKKIRIIKKAKLKMISSSAGSLLSRGLPPLYGRSAEEFGERDAAAVVDLGS